MRNIVLKWRSLTALGMVAALVFVVACGGDDEEPAPATPDFAKLIQDAVGNVPQGASAAEIEDLVSKAVNAALAAQPGLTRADVQAIVSSATADQLSAQEVQRIVDQSVRALPIPEALDAADISKLVEEALPELPETVSAAQISQIVQNQVSAGLSGQLTRGDVEDLVEQAVSAAVSGQLSADQVKAIVETSLEATNKAIEEAAMAAEDARMTAMQAVEAVEQAYRGPDSITVAVGALPVTTVGNTIPSLQSRVFSRLMYRQLAALNGETGAFEPELLEHYKLLEDGVTVEIKLKEGITFHNGETLDAHGLKKSIDLLLDSDPQKFTWSYRALQQNNYKYGTPNDDGTREGMAVVDDLTLHLELISPTATWSRPFDFMALAPNHLEAVGLDGYLEDPVGTGPYKFVEWERDNYIQLTRWEDYPGPKPVIKDIRIRHVPEASVRLAGLKAGEFDLITAAPPENVPGLISDGFQIFVGDSTQSMYIGLNIYGRSEPLQDKLVRQALLYAVDMDGIWETVAGGYGTRLQCQIVAPGGFGYNEDLVGRYDYNPDKARELLAEAGYADGLTLPGSVTNARYFRDRPLMDAIVAQWAAVGVNVDLEYLESSAWLQKLIDQTLPDAFMNIGLNWYLSDNTTSMWGNGLADPAFRDMIQAKNQIADTATREVEVKRIAEHICEDAQAIHAYTIPSVIAFGPSLPSITVSNSFELKIPTE